LIRRVLIPLVFLGFCLLARSVASADGASELRVEPVIVETDRGRTAFQAEIADTAGARSVGLMFRDTMAADHGMLFDFGTPRPVAMWMKDTKLSLDMIFADQTGRVVGIAENTVPFSVETISVNEPVKAVLEVNAGTARRIGLKPGARLIHRIFQKSGDGG
jgi:uncharacterized membrane protein (UPF0127 family)